jgi:hypothetical protein
MPLYGVVNVVNNPSFTNQQAIILQTVMSPEGYIDELLYDKFWLDFKDPTIKKQLRKLNLSKILLVGQKIQYENFKSARLSIQKKHPVKTKKLLELYKEAENLGMDLEIPKQNTDLFLKAAANKEAVNKNGVLTYITDDLIDRVIINLEASIERVGLLLSSEWKEIQRERKIGKAKIIWTQPFNFEKKEEHFNGTIINSNSYLSLMNENTFLMINEVDVKNSDTNLCVNNYAKSFEASPLTTKRTLQNHTASTGSFVAKIDSDRTFFNIMCVKANESMYIVSVGSSTLENSLFYFDKAIQSIMLP